MTQVTMRQRVTVTALQPYCFVACSLPRHSSCRSLICLTYCSSCSFMALYQKKRSDVPEPLLPGPAKGLKRTAPGRRPFRGVAGTASLETPRTVRPAFGRFGRKQEPMLTHGSDCQRAWSGPLVTLVVFSGVEVQGAASARCRGSSLIRCYSAGESASSRKVLCGRG